MAACHRGAVLPQVRQTAQHAAGQIVQHGGDGIVIILKCRRPENGDGQGKQGQGRIAGAAGGGRVGPPKGGAIPGPDDLGPEAEMFLRPDQGVVMPGVRTTNPQPAPARTYAECTSSL